MRFPLLCSLLILAGSFGAISAQGISFSENKGQWPEDVLFRSRIGQSTLFVEKSAFTFMLWSGGEHLNHGRPEEEHEQNPLRGHAYRVNFIGGKAFDHVLDEKYAHYENYFLGDDPSKWAGGVGVGASVELVSVWPGIDLNIKGGSAVKYDFVVSAGSDPAQVKLGYEGSDKLKINSKGDLIVETSVGQVVEEAPYAYQIIEGQLVEVPCRFRLKGNVVSFDFPSGYDEYYELVIDPILAFSTYVGSSADNFGFTATYDNDGHLYGGGIVFGVGYPTTLGVISPTYGGAVTDIGISKFLPDGSGLVWSTYVGGSNNESPHSLVVNSNNELYILGASGSPNFPTTASAFANIFNGGPSLTWLVIPSGYGFNYNLGTDIVVTHLAADAMSLIGSTFVGGTDNDGLNNDALLAYNYGDVFRGEIALDANENPLVSTSTHSTNAPITGNAAQPNFGGGPQDGYVFRMDPTLSNLQWATYLGGSGSDSGLGLQFDSNGNVFVTGGTSSNNFPMAGNPADNSQNGQVDGYVVKYNPTGALIASTFLGTSVYDQSYFVQLSVNDEVYVIGQSEGNFPVSPGKYNNPSSHQFIQKYNNALSNLEWSTVVGSGNGFINISPTAFLVADCGQIYISGWGGGNNVFALATNSTTGALPTTADAFDASTDGNDFYLMVLEPEATGLVYGSFFGGQSNAEHVDGGTSRFSKDGTVYQAVCAGCGLVSDFPTTPGSWSQTNPSTNCNLGVIKFNLNKALAIVGINGPTYLCLPNATAQFTNTSVGGTTYLWDFGDQNSSTAPAPMHVYNDTGTYVVTMILSDSLGCLIGDTAEIIIHVYDPFDTQISPPDTVCAGTVYQLQASGGYSYQWFPTTGLSDPTIPNPTVTVNSNVSYSVAVTDSCGTDTASTTLTVSAPSSNAGPDQTICVGGSAVLQGPASINPGSVVQWSPATGLNNPNISQPTASPLDTTTYVLTITDNAGCAAIDSVQVMVQFGPPPPVANDTVTCINEPVLLTATGGDSYVWTPHPTLGNIAGATAIATPTTSTIYTVSISNQCGTTLDSAFVLVPIVNASAWPDDTICPGTTVPIFASGGMTYQWFPSAGLSNDTAASTLATPSSSITYSVAAFDQFGCSDTAQVSLTLYPQPTVDAGEDIILEFGDSGQLSGTGSGFLVWTPNIAISCTACPNPTVAPNTTTTYTLTVTDENGCIATDDVTVFLEGSLYVPNSFTPDGDGDNDFFYAYATEVKEFEMLIFNRWGELIWENNNYLTGWDGTYKGTLSQNGTYVWKVRMVELTGKLHNKFGHVNLIR